MKECWYVYIITNYKNTVLYIGSTNNLERRIKEHRRGYKRDAFTKKYRLYKLIWFEEFKNKKEAREMEKKMKKWKREKKMRVIKKLNSNFINLLRSANRRI